MSIRTERLGAVIQRDLGEILQQKYQTEGSIITVTGIRVSPDLSIARAYISILAPGRNVDSVFQNIEDHTAEIRYELATRIRHQVRRIPEILFHMDDSAEYVSRIESLFSKIEEERKSRNLPDAGTEDEGDEKGPEGGEEPRGEEGEEPRGEGQEKSGEE